jgi:hypothetical protein
MTVRARCHERCASASFRKTVGSAFQQSCARRSALDRGGGVIELVRREIHIRTVDEPVSEAQAIARRLAAGNPGASVDAFLAKPV